MEAQNYCPKDAQVAVVMVPLPSQGHLNQLLHLSHLITSYDISVHYVGSAPHNRQAKLRLHGQDTQSLTKIHFHDLKPTPNPKDATLLPAHLPPLLNTSLHLRQPVCQLLQEFAAQFRRIVVIHDSYMSSVVQDVKFIPNAEAYEFVPNSAFTVFLGTWETIPEKPFQLDSDVPSCTPSNEGCNRPKNISFIDYQQKFKDFQSGRLFNTSREIEGKYVELLERILVSEKTKHFTIGPLNPIELKATSEKCRHGCLEWLDKRLMGSVVYVSFGSTTSMTDEQIRELALGLERSGQQFIWVLRNADKYDIFEEDEARAQLPDRYEERVKDRGLVVRDWAPQLEILAHPSTGGFMSHCGWNSCLESISMGVPIVAWPMQFDQPRNAILVAEVLKIGMVIRDWANRAELVTSTTIENMVRRLMSSNEGTEMRQHAAELSDRVRSSIAKGGSSRLEMESFIAHITR